MVGALTGYLMASQETPAELYRVGLGSVPFLMACGDLLIGWLLLHHADIATAALADGAAERDVPFYEGKIAAGRFFARNMLPLLSGVRETVGAIDGRVMELSESAF